MTNPLERPSGEISGYLQDAMAYAQGTQNENLAQGGPTEGMEVDLRKGVKTRLDKDGFEKGCSRQSGCKPAQAGGCSLKSGCNPQRTYTDQEAKNEDKKQSRANEEDLSKAEQAAAETQAPSRDQSVAPRERERFEIPVEKGLQPQIDNMQAGFDSQMDVSNSVQMQDSSMNTLMEEIRGSKDFYNSGQDMQSISNQALMNTLAPQLESAGIDPSRVQFDEDQIQQSMNSYINSMR